MIGIYFTSEESSTCSVYQLASSRADPDVELEEEVGRQCPERISYLSEPSAVPTCATNLVFQKLFKDSSVSIADVLSEVARLGVKEHWLVEESEVAMLADNPLGHGSFGMVHHGVYYGAPVALKLSLPIRKDDYDIINELQIMRRLRHPNLVHMLGAVVLPQKQRVGLILELVQPGGLHNFMLQAAACLRSRYDIILGVCRALWFLHSCLPVVVHGDLKDRNVLVSATENGVQAKLADFGLSRLLTRGARPMSGTLRWMAPEVVQSRGVQILPSSDMFSFGRLVFFVATGIEPYCDISEDQLMEHLSSGDFPSLHWPDTCLLEQLCRPLVQDCLQLNAFERPHASDLCETIESWSADIDRDVGPADPADDGASSSRGSSHQFARFRSL